MDLLVQMRTFMRIVETGSLSVAARTLNLSLPAVSRQISALEKSLGAALLLRTTKNVSITEGGRRYYDRCLRVLREVEAAQSAVHSTDEVAGLLTVSAPVTLGLSRVAPHLPPLLAEHPELRVEMRFEDRLVDLVGEGVNVAIRGGAPIRDSAAIIARPLTTFARVVVASPDYLERHGEPNTPEMLAHHQVLVHLGASGPGEAWRFMREGMETTVEVRGPLRTNAPQALREAAIAGLGLALLPSWLVADDTAAGRLRVVLGAFLAAPVVVSGVYGTEMRSSPRVKAFLDHLVAAYAVERAKLAGHNGIE